MPCFESKKIALLRILEILQRHTDINHHLMQTDILAILENDYGIELERKAVGANIALLREAGYDIISKRDGCYLNSRTFQDTEIHMLVDGVIASKHINQKHSKDLITKLVGLASPSYQNASKYIYAANTWEKTDNVGLFSTIDLIYSAIAKKRQIKYDFSKYQKDKKLHVSSQQYASPYFLLLHNQRYYLMSFNEKYKNICYHRVDRISNVIVTDEPATKIQSIKGYENGIDYKRFSTAMPYMYADEPERINFLAEDCIIDQVIDWFGKDITITDTNNPKTKEISVIASPKSMEIWAMQYSNYVQVISPQNLRNNIVQRIKDIVIKYGI